jgi:hypothetical protein
MEILGENELNLATPITKAVKLTACRATPCAHRHRDDIQPVVTGYIFSFLIQQPQQEQAYAKDRLRAVVDFDAVAVASCHQRDLDRAWQVCLGTRPIGSENGNDTGRFAIRAHVIRIRVQSLLRACEIQIR